MQFNSSKCHILSISRQRNPTLASYYLGTDQLSSVDSYPYLGITISSDLRWDKHVSAVSSKATKYLNFIRRNIYSCPPDVKSLAYTSLVTPILEYVTAAWDPYRAKDINKLDMVQRRAARFVKRDYRQTTSVSSLLDQLGCPSLSDRQLNNRLKIFGKTVAGRVAIDTGDLAQPLRQTRYSDLDLSFTALAARTDVYKYSFFPRTIRDWNSLDTLSRSRLIPRDLQIGCLRSNRIPNRIGRYDSNSNLKSNRP